MAILKTYLFDMSPGASAEIRAMFTPTEDMKGYFEFNMTATDTDRKNKS